MNIPKIKLDPFFYSIVLFQFYKHFIKLGNFYKMFIYFFYLNKFLKKKLIDIFKLISFIISDYFLSLDLKSKILVRKKKTAKKFKRKRKKKIKNLKRLLYVKSSNFPKKKIFKLIRRFYIIFLIKKKKFFLLKIYNSYIRFFFFDFKVNHLKRFFLAGKKRVINIIKRNNKFKSDLLFFDSFKPKKKIKGFKVFQLFKLQKFKKKRFFFIKK
jgi:hypothetical protein